MLLLVDEGADLKLCEAPSRSYTSSLLRSKDTFRFDTSLTLYVRVASAAPAARFKRRYRKVGDWPLCNGVAFPVQLTVCRHVGQ
jgi:hypothetical protein